MNKTIAGFAEGKNEIELVIQLEHARLRSLIKMDSI